MFFYQILRLEQVLIIKEIIKIDYLQDNAGIACPIKKEVNTKYLWILKIGVIIVIFLLLIFFRTSTTQA